MYLYQLKLWNFRKYGNDLWDLKKPHLVVPFQKGFNLLIGENDSGKTAILDAIKVVLKTHAYEWIKIDDTDFFSSSKKLRIELLFKGFTNSEAKNFTDWIGYEGEGDEAEPLLRLIYQVERNNERILPSEIKAGMDDFGSSLNAIARDYLKITYLKALRDADSDLVAKKNSRLSQILKNHELFVKKSQDELHDFERYIVTANNKIKKWLSKEETGGNQISTTLNQYINSFIDDKLKSNLGLDNPDIKSILEKFSLTIDSSHNLGLGSMNRLYMAAELLHLNKESDHLKLALVEELEAHLHPQAQMKVTSALQKEEKVQFILTTHSPNLASKVKLDNIILCKNNDVFSLKRELTNFPIKSYKYLENFLDVTKANLFFAKGIILVEGWSEQILIPVIANKLGYDLTSKEITIINVGSTAYLHFARIFTRKDGKHINIPVAIISDLDNKPNDNEDFPKKTRKKLKEELNLNVMEDSSIKLFYGKQWTLEWCLYKSSSLSKLFKESVSEVHCKTKEYQQIDSEGKINPNFEEDFKIKLIKALKKDGTSLDKLQIAVTLAKKIEEQNTNIELNDEYILYIIKAIEHVCK